jgi:hypothetical protein
MDPGAVVMLIPIAGMGVGALFLVGIYKLLVRWMDRNKSGDTGGLAEEVARLREEVEVFREVNQRVLELEERVDFTERLLAQHRERGRLPAEG